MGIMEDGNTAALRTHEREQASTEKTHQLFEGRAIEELTDEYLDGQQSSLYRTTYGLVDVLMAGLDHESACGLLAKLYVSKEKEDTALEYDATFKVFIRSWLETSQVGAEILSKRIFDLDDLDDRDD